MYSAVAYGLIERLPLFLAARVVSNCVSRVVSACCDRALTVGSGLWKFGV